ncbi:EAL and HDOD domain-containing protein [Methylocaldum sp.]|uniref:EAL and HDOD domain-containing protein n=1 Tax=Methylocaldum sp. TaxID=1969727 RepID=UPI002D485622|nr:HDOD domain-containing protein [Methylocaldum sp.]HYE37008.1 HDOD domain-containing protein [Methylocaldum sp.]
MFDGLVGRTPIYTRTLDVYGYELSFCSGEALRLGTKDSEAQWTEAVRQAGQDLDLRDLIGDSRAMIRVTSGALGVCETLAWPKSQVVLAISEEALNDGAAEETASRLAREGFTIALHNPSCDLVELRREADYVSICSLDAQKLNGFKTDGMGGHYDQNMHLLVRDVETPDEYDRFSKLGFDYYEGMFFERPRHLHSCEIPGNRLAVLELLARLQNPKVDVVEAEAIITRDMTLSYKLLRLINSAFFGVSKRVDSIRRAVIFFGLQRIKNWASVILVNSVDYRPRELLTTAMVRARTCELLAEQLQRPNTELYYMAGLFSLVDAVMDVPREQILQRLNLADAISEALLHGSGPVGEVLRAVIAFERAEPGEIQGCQFAQGVPARAYVESIRWATGVQRALASS